MNAQLFLQRHRITVDEYGQMGTAGIFREDDRIELIDGEIIDMAPIGTRHAECVSRLARIFFRESDATVRVQDPIFLDATSQPQPGLVIAKSRNYASAPPGADDVWLLIEVADSSVDYDRGTKIPLYASHDIPEVWLIDLAAEKIEVYREPDAAGYCDVRIHNASDLLEPALLSGLVIPIVDVLP